MKQGEDIAVRRRIGPIRALDVNGDPVIGEDFSGAGEAEISVNGRAWGAVEGTFDEIGDGYYYYNPVDNETRERGFIAVKVSGVCVEYVFREDIEPWPQGIPVASTGEQDLHVGPLVAVDETDAPVLGENFSGAGELEVSINGAAWAAASGRVVEIGDGYYDYIPPTAEVSDVGWLAVKIAGVCEEFVIRSAVVARPGVTVGVSTAATIRDRIYQLIEAIIPASLTRDAFRRYRNEGGADFRAWAEAHPNAALRRFQVRRAGTEEGPDVSNIDVERVRVMFEIVIAYPQTHRYGADNAMDRDDVMDEDCRALDAAVGLYSRGNFSDSHDCTPLTSFGAAQDREEGEGVDFMVIEAQYEFVRATRVA